MTRESTRRGFTPIDHDTGRGFSRMFDTRRGFSRMFADMMNGILRSFVIFVTS